MITNFYLVSYPSVFKFLQLILTPIKEAKISCKIKKI